MTMMMTSSELTIYGLLMTILGFAVGWGLRHVYGPTVPAPRGADTRYRRVQAFLDACSFSMSTRASIDLTSYEVGKVIVDGVAAMAESKDTFQLTTAGGQTHIVRIT